MNITFILNGGKVCCDTAPDKMLLELLREKGCYSVKRGCETSNCGLCTVLLDGKAILSCSYLAVRADGHNIVTIEGMGKRAEQFGEFLADEGAEQCGYCSPGFIMNVLAMEDEFTKNGVLSPTEEQIREYLAGNLCRCSGYMGQSRAVHKYLQSRKADAKSDK